MDIDPDQFLSDLPEILRFRRVNRQANSPMKAYTGPTPPQLYPELMQSILSRNRDLSIFPLTGTAIPVPLLRERCFDAVTEAEIINSLYYIKTQPIGQRFEFMFYTNNLVESTRSDGSIYNYVGFGVIISGDIMWNGSMFECDFGHSGPLNTRLIRPKSFQIEQPESFIDELDRNLYPKRKHTPTIIMFLPSFQAIKLFVGNRTQCSMIPNFPNVYLGRLLDALYSIAARYPRVVSAILQMYITPENKNSIKLGVTMRLGMGAATPEEELANIREAIEYIRSQEVKPQID